MTSTTFYDGFYLTFYCLDRK